jgi:hypothetical protein
MHCFMQGPSILLQCTPPFSTFIKSFSSFVSFCLQVFGCLLGPKNFDSLEGPLACKHISFLITLSCARFLLITTIAQIIYLNSWAVVASIIVVKFMVDHHPFLLETLTRMDNNTFPFQQHLKGTCNLLLPPICACLLPFEQLI